MIDNGAGILHLLQGELRSLLCVVERFKVLEVVHPVKDGSVRVALLYVCMVCSHYLLLLHNPLHVNFVLSTHYVYWCEFGLNVCFNFQCQPE